MAALSLAVSCDPKNNEPVVTDTLTVSPTSISFKADETDTHSVLVSTKGDWEVSTTQDWIVFPTRTSGTGNGSFDVKVKPNTGGDRTGSITVKGASTVTVSVSQSGKNIIVVNPDPFDGVRRSSTTYQLLIYTFADSNGDGVGDFNGITSKLDYLKDLGVTALWLSPAHPTSSYHGYDVDDYGTVNPLFGTEQDFKNLVDKAHDNGIQIYMDYVLNHSGRNHEWFQDAAMDPSSLYRDYYIFSEDPEADINAKRIPMLATEGKNAYQSGEWYATGGSGRFKFHLNWVSDASPTITVTQTKEKPYTGKSGKWLFFGDGVLKEFLQSSGNTYDLVVDFDSDWGFLIRTSSTSWNAGEKYGMPSSKKSIVLGEPFVLAPNTNSYDPGDVSLGALYHSNFAKSMPDLNYGPLETAESSPAFLALAESADRWIREFGIDGFRLDAVKHIYHNQRSEENPTFLAKWYERCNRTFQEKHDSDMFMVGEVLDAHSMEKNYYKGLPSLFEFGFRDQVLYSLKSGNGASFASTVTGFIKDHQTNRPSAETSIIIGNHDITRVASELAGKDSDAKIKQAAVLLLTSEGKPFVFQGDELGYWGDKSRNGDEDVRMPIQWDKKATDCAKKGLPNGIDSNMLKKDGGMSVEEQNADETSVLNVYKAWIRLRNTYPALANGKMTDAGLKEKNGGNAIASWYMVSGSQKLLVIHNLAGSEKSVKVTDDTSHPVALLGSAELDGQTLTLAGNSSVVFKL